MRRLLERNYKSVYVPGLGRRLDFRGPSKVISQVSMEQRRRVRSQSPDDKDEQSELESGQCSEQNSPQMGRAGSNAAATGKRAAAEDARALRNQARGSQKKPASCLSGLVVTVSDRLHLSFKFSPQCPQLSSLGSRVFVHPLSCMKRLGFGADVNLQGPHSLCQIPCLPPLPNSTTVLN